MKEYKNLHLRVEKGNITITEIARELDLNRETISRWFNDKQMSSLQEARVREAIRNIKAKQEA